jgi:hypothetical protein
MRSDPIDHRGRLPSDAPLWNADRVVKPPVDLDICSCCGFRTGGSGTCPVCFWTNDGQDDGDPDVVRGGPNGDLSLSHARLNFEIYGASHPRYQETVRPPRDDERP